MNINPKNAAVYGFAAFAAWFAWRSMGKPGAAAAAGLFDVFAGQRQDSGANVAQNTQKISEVLDGNGGQFSNGWRYFTDGTSISPSGDYYLNGSKIWSPA